MRWAQAWTSSKMTAFRNVDTNLTALLY